MELLLTSKENKVKPMDQIPGPRGLELITIGSMLQKSPLQTYLYVQEVYGDMVFGPWLGRPSIFLYNPEHVRHVLKDNHANYAKSKEYKHLKPLLGEGLLTSENELWRKERRIMAKEFHPARIDQYVTSIQDKTLDLMAELQNANLEGTFDVTPYLSKLTFQIAGDIFFGASVDQFASVAQNALNTETNRANKKMRRLANFPDFVPTKENREGNKAVQNLQSIVHDIMAKDDHEGKYNILSKLMTHTDSEGNKLSKNQIRDEVMTLLLAGHETTSTALMWTMYLLSQNPQWQTIVYNELKANKKTAADLTQKDFENLPNLKAVFLESLRLLPPIPAISRQALEDDVIGGFLIEKGTSMMCNAYVTHRDKRYWERPLEYTPDRFFEENWEKKHEFSFFPFARGPRSCIGEDLAMVEGQLILAHLIENFTWEKERNFEPIMGHHLTLQSENGMRLKLTKRV